MESTQGVKTHTSFTVLFPSNVLFPSRSCFLKSLLFYGTTIVLHFLRTRLISFPMVLRKLTLSMKDKNYTRDCTKQTSKIPQLQNIDLNLLTITFHLSLFTKPAPLWLLLIVLKRACVFFLARFLIDRCQILTDICTKNV